MTVYVITHDFELILECCTDIIHFENGAIADQYSVDREGLEKIKQYFVQGLFLAAPYFQNTSSPM